MWLMYELIVARGLSRPGIHTLPEGNGLGHPPRGNGEPSGYKPMCKVLGNIEYMGLIEVTLICRMIG